MTPDKRTTDTSAWAFLKETIWSTPRHPTEELTSSQAVHTPEPQLAFSVSFLNTDRLPQTSRHLKKSFQHGGDQN